MIQQHKSSNNLGLKIGLSLVGVIAVSTIVYASYGTLQHNIAAKTNAVYMQCSSIDLYYRNKLKKYDKSSQTKQSIDIVAENNDASKTNNNALNVKPADESRTSPGVADTNGVGRQLDVRNGVYIIQHGDTLSELSATLGYSVDELAQYNNIRNVNRIYTGSVLRLPPR